MNKEFIPYEQALELKEIRFDEPCLAYWNIDPQLKNPTFNMVKPFEHEWCLPSPMFSQAFRWFREKYELEGVPQRAENFVWYKWTIYQYNENGKEYVAAWHEYKTYEEAELACLIKLIQIIRL